MTDPITQLPMIDAEAVRYVIENGRMEPMEVIQERIAEKAGLQQQMMQMQQHAQQLEMENQSLRQNVDMLSSQQMQQDQEREMFSRQMQMRKMDMEEAKTASQMLKDQSNLLGGVVASG